MKSADADSLARELAATAGETLTEAVTTALAERLSGCRRPKNAARRLAIHAIRERVSKLPVLDDRPDDEIVGYDRTGPFG